MKYLKLCFVLLLLAWVSVVEAQTTKVRGKVVDAETGEPMPLVSIVFVGTTIGVTTDFDGNYDIETREDVSEIMASFVSYERQTVAVKKGAFNTIDFRFTISDQEQPFKMKIIPHHKSSITNHQLNHSFTQYVVYVYHSFVMTIFINNNQLSDTILFHHPVGIICQFVL